MSQVERRGSEKCPIDLTEDDSPDRQESKRSMKSQRKHFKAVKRRIKRLEAEIMEPRTSDEHEGASKRFVIRDETASFTAECQDLKNRLGSLESWARSMCHAFVHSPGDGEAEFDGENTFQIIGPTEEQGASSFDFESVLAHAERNDSISLQLLSDGDNQDEHPLDNIRDTIHDDTVLVQSCQQAPDYILNHTDTANINCCERPEQPQIAQSNSNILINGHDQEDDNEEDEHQILDTKPDLQTAYEKINLWRDDQGRILMFLYCTAKRLRTNSNQIAGVCGMYLIDDLHNEFGFMSKEGMRNVKIEAEIRAALFGLELIKSLFKGSLDDVCVMIISSCPVLVQAMKAERVYPRFYSCSCHFRDCEHSGSRWITDHPIGKSHFAILPDLMVSMKSLRVHWCKLENVTEEEKKVVNFYKNLVDAWLSAYIKEQRRKYPLTPERLSYIP